MSSVQASPERPSDRVSIDGRSGELRIGAGGGLAAGLAQLAHDRGFAARNRLILHSKVRRFPDGGSAHLAVWLGVLFCGFKQHLGAAEFGLCRGYGLGIALGCGCVKVFLRLFNASAEG